jgi:hypothetical protein
MPRSSPIWPPQATINMSTPLGPSLDCLNKDFSELYDLDSSGISIVSYAIIANLYIKDSKNNPLYALATYRQAKASFGSSSNSTSFYFYPLAFNS